MSLKNLSKLPPPAQVDNKLSGNAPTTFGLSIAISGVASTCRPKHCGGAGECRKTLWVEYGDESVPNDGPGHPGLDNYKAAGNSYFIVEHEDDDDTSFVGYFGESFSSYIDMYNRCDPEGSNPRVVTLSTGGTATGCYDPLMSFSTDGGTQVYVPTGHSTQTACLQYASSLPSGQTANWYTNVNPSLWYLMRGPGDGYGS